MRSIIGLVGISLIGAAIWYAAEKLPLDPSAPLGVPLLVFGAALISFVLAIEHLA